MKKKGSELEVNCVDVLDRISRLDSKLIDIIYKRNSLTLYPSFRNFQLNFFGHIDPINIIPTTTALKFRFSNYFFNGDWDTLLIVTDKGYNLFDALEELEKNIPENWIDNKDPRKIYCILSDLEHTKESQICKIRDSKKLKRFKLDIIFLKLPFYDHNSHMKIFYKKEGKYNGKPYIRDKNAVYYYKKGFSNNINALHLSERENQKNMRILAEKFTSYVVKAIHYDKKSKKENASQIDMEQSLLHINNYFELERKVKGLMDKKYAQLRKIIQSDVLNKEEWDQHEKEIRRNRSPK